MRKYHAWHDDVKYYGLYINWYVFPVPNKYDRSVVLMFETDPYIIFPKQ